MIPKVKFGSNVTLELLGVYAYRQERDLQDLQRVPWSRMLLLLHTLGKQQTKNILANIISHYLALLLTADFYYF